MDQHDWRRAIRLANELLEQRWDPIGVYHQGDEEQWPPGEYETYAGWLVEELANGAGVTQVADRLRKAQHRMGVDFPDLVDEQMVAVVVHEVRAALRVVVEHSATTGHGTVGRDPELERILAAGAELAPTLVGLPLPQARRIAEEHGHHVAVNCTTLDLRYDRIVLEVDEHAPHQIVTAAHAG
jgi:hypothetical protein